MDFKINSDSFKLDQVAILTKQSINSILGDVAASARNHWIKIAREDKSHLMHDYLRSIRPVKVGKHAWTITLVGELAHVIEDGSPLLDMRETLLGPNIPVSPVGERGKHQNKQGGFYRAIPFRHTGPSSGKVIGRAMGSAYAKKLGIESAYKLGKSIQGLSRKLTATKTNPYSKKTEWGNRLKAGYAPKIKAHHKTDIYAGMVKQAKTYEKATQSQYTTFRTISTNTNEGWIRKPIPARHYAEDVQEFVNRIIPKAIEAYLKGVGDD